MVFMIYVPLYLNEFDPQTQNVLMAFVIYVPLYLNAFNNGYWISLL